MSKFGPAGDDRIIPIPIRDGVTVYVADIPHDLRPAEARKIAAVIQALALEPNPLPTPEGE